MKFLHILAIVSALFMVFGAVAPSTHADDKFAAAHGPLRLKLIAYDGDPKKKAPEKLSFQINTIDLKERSEFLKLGERIANTKWKLVKFEYKTRLNPISDELEDVSELTITDIETKRDVVLIFLRTTNVAAPVN